LFLGAAHPSAGDLSISKFHSIAVAMEEASPAAAATAAAADTTDTTDANPEIVQSVLQACSAGDLNTVTQIVAQHGRLYGCHQDQTTGQSPLMVASNYGHVNLVRYLLEDCHAPWNAVDRHGHCAGNFATDQTHWPVVELLVDWGTRAELILGTIERQSRESSVMMDDDDGEDMMIANGSTTTPLEHLPSTKPDYLRQKLHYKKNVLLDSDQDAVMMEWERPLMKAHAEILLREEESGNNNRTTSDQPLSRPKRVLNVGFGMGIIDGIFQNDYHPAHHIIIEAHPDVYRRMQDTGWTTRPNVRVCFGKWQDVLPQLIREGIVVDAIFFDTYGEHYLDMQDFHVIMTQLLAKPHGIYSFFNGLAPDNIFFHGVACQCVKLHLASLGLDSEFAACEIQGAAAAVNNDPTVWQDVRRKYWHGRDTYYLPIVKWNAQFLLLSNGPMTDDSPFRKRKVNGENGGSIMEDIDVNVDEQCLKRPAC
jgi:type IV protein arginine methyltransferase